jgi:hypothetical protein
MLKDTPSARAELKTHMLCDGHRLVVSIIETFAGQPPPTPPKAVPVQSRRFGAPPLPQSRSNGKDWLVVVLELAAGGDLFDRLQAAPDARFTEVSASGCRGMRTCGFLSASADTLKKVG